MAVEFLPYRPHSGRGVWWLLTLLLAVPLVLVAITTIPALVGLRQMQYELTPAAVRIHYGFRPFDIPRAAIINAELITLTGKGRRLFGIGMPGLCQGRWSWPQTGTLMLYSTCQEELVLLTTADGKWGITPADAQSFLGALADNRTGRWLPSRALKTAGALATMILATVVIAVLLPLGLLYWLWRLPKTLVYRLTTDHLEIGRGWPRVCIPYGQITAISEANPKGRPLRIIGTELPGLLWGRFSWRQAGGKIRMYATRTKPFVLIESGGGLFGVTPADPGGFIRALSARTAGGQ